MEDISFGEFICILFALFLFFYLFKKTINAIDRHKEEVARENRRRQEEIDRRNQAHQREVEKVTGTYNSQQNQFYRDLSNFFGKMYFERRDSYWDIYQSLKNTISEMSKTNMMLKSLTKYRGYDGPINICTKLAEEFFTFGDRVNKLPDTRMIDPDNYGSIRKDYWDSVRSMHKAAADAYIKACQDSLSSRNYSEIFAIDIEEVLRCIWFYATEKPYSAESYQKAADVFNHLVEESNVDVKIAELYAMKQMGGEGVVRDTVRSMTSYSAEKMTLIASALMWIKEYQAENMVLQNMLSSGKQMTAKTQERLHSLTNGGGKAPDGYNVVSDENAMYIDVSSLAWKDDEYNGLFENFAFQEKTLSYSLAVRDENKDLFITNGISVPDTNKILAKLKTDFADEYGDSVTAERKKCVAMSGSGEENLDGILIETSECRQMGIFVHVVRIGKKLNIKFYTLFLPVQAELAEQKQQAVSLYKKLSPSVTMWESSLKDTVLMAIQQLLNSNSQTVVSSGNTDESGSGPVF